MGINVQNSGFSFCRLDWKNPVVFSKTLVLWDCLFCRACCHCRELLSVLGCETLSGQTAQLQAAQCNDMFEVGPPVSQHRSYWSHKKLFWVAQHSRWTQTYCSRGNCYTEDRSSIPQMCDRCGQIIGQASTMHIVSHKLRWSTRTVLYALILLSFFFPVFSKGEPVTDCDCSALCRRLKIFEIPVRTSDFQSFNPKEGFPAPNWDTAHLSSFCGNRKGCAFNIKIQTATVNLKLQ